MANKNFLTKLKDGIEGGQTEIVAGAQTLKRERKPKAAKAVAEPTPEAPGKLELDVPTKLPRLPRKPKPAVNACSCGCGTLVARRFVPGHDAKLHAWVIRVERGLLKLAEIKHEGVRAAVAAKVAK